MHYQNHQSESFIRRHFDVIIVLLVGVLLCVPIFCQMGQGLHIVGDDSDFHFWRIQAAVAGWNDGQTVPQVNPNMLFGFGYAQNLFYGPLIVYFASVIFAICQSWVVVYNLIFAGLIILSGYLMLFAMKKITNNRRMAMIAAILYLLAPYHVMRTFVANSLGETVVFCAIPILMLGLWGLIEHKKDAYIYLAVAVITIVLSHNLSILLLGLSSVAFLLCNIKKIWRKETLIQILKAAGITLVITAFFVVPLIEAKSTGVFAIFDQKYLETANHMSGELLNEARAGLIDYLKPGYSRQAFIGMTGLMAVLVFPFIGIKIKDKKQKSSLFAVYFIMILALILTSKLINWNLMPFLLRQMQFSWRFLIVFVTGVAILNAYIIDNFLHRFDKRWLKMLVAIVFGVILILEDAFVIDFNNRFTEELGGVWAGIGIAAEYAPTTALTKNDTIFENYSHNGFWTGAYDAIKETINSYQNQLLNFEKDGTRMEFDVELSEQTQALELPVFYYPGYEAYLGLEKLSTKCSINGLLELEVPAAKSGHIKVFYGLSFGTKIGLIITATGTVAIIGLYLLGRKKATN